jgi:CBS domain-containing protein
MPVTRRTGARDEPANAAAQRTLLEVMTSPVLTLTTSQPASDALAVMQDAGVRHAVVLLGDDIVGVISERDLGGSHGGVARRHRTVQELMHVAPAVAAPAMSIGEAVHLVREQRIGCLPVVDEGRLVGIVTRSDLLRLLDPEPRDERARWEELGDERPEPLISPNRDKWP